MIVYHIFLPQPKISLASFFCLLLTSFYKFTIKDEKYKLRKWKKATEHHSIFKGHKNN